MASSQIPFWPRQQIRFSSNDLLWLHHNKMFRWSLIVIPNYRATEFVRQRVRLILLIERGLDTWLQYLILVALFLLLWRLIQAPGTCDFENGLCGYTHDQNSDFEWTNNTGVTTSFNTGPLGDHTTGSGQALQQHTLNSKCCVGNPYFWPHLCIGHTDQPPALIRQPTHEYENKRLNVTLYDFKFRI